MVKKRVFDERSAHSKAVLDDSHITVDTTAHHSIKGLAKKSHESHNLRIVLSTVIFSSVVISLPMSNLCIPAYSLVGLQISEISDLLYDL